MGKMTQSGIGDLIYQTSFAIDGSLKGRYAARLYRPIIYLAATMMILLTAIIYADRSPLVPLILIIASLAYAILFILRMRMSPTVERRFYRQRYQLLRGQLSLAGVAVISTVLFLYGAVDHNLWLLYILSILIISEHNSSRAVFLTLVEVLLFIVVPPLFILIVLRGWSIEYFAEVLLLRLFIQMTGIALLTFVSHYFIRNIQGREIAVLEYQRWEEAMTHNTALMEEPADQLRAITRLVEGLTNARARLWLVRLSDGHLTDGDDDQPSAQVLQCRKTGRPGLATAPAPPPPTQTSAVVLGRLARFMYRHLARDIDYPQEFEINRDAILPKNVCIEITIPIILSDNRVIGVIDVLYDQAQQDEMTLSRHCHRLLAFAGYAQIVIINATRITRYREEERLSEALRPLRSTHQVAAQVAADLTEILGFDFAAVWIVDQDNRVLSCIEHRNAPWGWEINLPLREPANSLAARVARDGKALCQAGPDEGLSRRLRRRFNLDKCRRMLIAIPNLSPSATPYVATGVIEIGFLPGRRGSIQPEMTHTLETYAHRVGLALAAAESLGAERWLNQSLATLLGSSRDFIRKSSYYTVQDTAKLIGMAADQFLGANIVRVFSWDESDSNLALVYPPPSDRQQRNWNPSTVRSENTILTRLYKSADPTFVSDVDNDLQIGQDEPDVNKFLLTSKRGNNIKSFAGLQLFGAGGEIHGFLCLTFRARHEFSERERMLLQLFALQAGVALEEAGYQKQTRDLLQARERVALSAELHHHMSQNLYALRMFANTTAHYAARQDDPKLQTSSMRVVELAGLSQAALGHMLGSLNQSPDSFVGILEELETHIAVLKRFDEKIHFHFEKRVGCSVPKQVQFYLYRIAIEALSNSVRHARATHINIHYIVSREGAVDLIVRDDGHGLVENKTGIGYGQDAMRYFAAKIRARVTVENNSERGTRVIAHFQPYNA